MFDSQVRSLAALVIAGGLSLAGMATSAAVPPEGGPRLVGEPTSGRSSEPLPELRATQLAPGQSPEEALERAAETVDNPPAYLGNNRYRCIYRDSSAWHYSWEGASASWEKADSAYNHYGAMDLRNTGWVGGTSNAAYEAWVGEGRRLAGEGWLRLTVKYPWRYSGDIDLLSEFSAVPVGGGFSSASIAMSFYVDLMRDDSNAKLVVDSFSITADKGVPGDFDDVRNDGLASRKVSLTGFGEVVRSAFGVDADLSTKTQSLTNARAAFDFRDDDGHGWKTGSAQRWVYTVKPGYVLRDCGEG